MRIICVIIFVISILGCEDRTTSQSDASRQSQQDVGRLAITNDVGLPDARPDIYIVRQWDAAVDAAVDAAPPQVCERLGLREACQIEGLLGPCAEGARVCNLTSWSNCTPVNFPRMETCDALDNDCDGQLNEAPNNLGDGHLDPQNVVLSRSCYTGAPGSSKEGVCRPGISFCQEMRRDTDAGVEVYYEYGSCEQQVTPSEEECDALDNDCDGQTDEGVLNVCNECGPDPIEICDGGHFDEDCDGLIDENLLNACSEIIVAAAFWSVMFIGIVDSFISFVRIEGLLPNIAVSYTHLTLPTNREV